MQTVLYWVSYSDQCNTTHYADKESPRVRVDTGASLSYLTNHEGSDLWRGVLSYLSDHERVERDHVRGRA